MGDQPHHLTEDDLFRSSTQYRLWSYSADALKSLRANINSTAAARVQSAVRKAHLAAGGEDAATVEVDCLTPDEELKIVGFYCLQAMEFAEFLDLPTNIKATAVQFLKRFYLSESPMTYHPKQLMPTALFLATKTDNHYMSLTRFASKLPKTTPEAVKAPEFTLVQGLRFSFDVRHPHRGLEGGFMELQAMMLGRYVPRASSTLSPQSIAESMLVVPSADASKPWDPTTAAVGKRLQAAHNGASHLLKTSALLSDAYFLYTPAQVWLAAFLAVDEPLAKFYLDTILSGAALKAPDPPDKVGSEEHPSSPLDAMLANVEACRQLLLSRAAGQPGEEEKRELRKIDKKLTKCQNPSKADLSSLKGSQVDKKRDSEEGTGEEDGRSKKKRKVEEDDVFGGKDLYAGARSK